jgi:hypothetical protein
MNYVVTAEDGETTKTYLVTVTVAMAPPSEDALITEFDLGGLDGTIDNEAETITLTVPFGTNLTGVMPTVTTSADAMVEPASGEAVTFMSGVPMNYVVTAEDGETTKTYLVTVTVAMAPPSADALITKFEVAGTEGVIDHDAATISVTVSMGTTLNDLMPTVTTSANATVDPASGAPVTFVDGEAKSYEVIAEDGDTTKIYAVTVTVESSPLSTVALITDFEVAGAEGVIDHGAGTISVTVPFGTNLTDVMPTVTTSASAMVDPASGAPVTFVDGEAENYEVTAEDGVSTRIYAVTVTVAEE